MFDRGGVLSPVLVIVVNDTGRGELVLKPQGRS